MVRLLSALLMVVAIVPCLHADTLIRIMTYNIHHGEGTDGKVDLDRIARVIQGERPDVLCLQEVDRGCARTRGLHMPTELSKRLNMDVRFGANLELQGGEYGNATLTRLPVASSENIDLPFPGNGERRGCLRVTLEVDGHEIDVYNTHFDLIASSRRVQADAILRRLREAPSIVAGDLNETAVDPALRILQSRMIDTFLWRANGSDGTFPGNGSARRIDFVLVSSSVNVLSSRVVDTPEARLASDHLPYVAELSLSPPDPTAKDKGVRDTEDERVERALKWQFTPTAPTAATPFLSGLLRRSRGETGGAWEKEGPRTAPRSPPLLCLSSERAR